MFIVMGRRLICRFHRSPLFTTELKSSTITRGSWGGLGTVVSDAMVIEFTKLGSLIIGLRIIIMRYRPNFDVKYYFPL